MRTIGCYNVCAAEREVPEDREIHYCLLINEGLYGAAVDLGVAIHDMAVQFDATGHEAIGYGDLLIVPSWPPKGEAIWYVKLSEFLVALASSVKKS